MRHAVRQHVIHNLARRKMKTEKNISFGHFKIKAKTFICAVMGGICFSSLVWAANCAKMYPADNIAELHHKYESGGNPCAFNKCAAGDIGGCSYGSSQLACSCKGCSKYATMGVYLKGLSKDMLAALGGGSWQSVAEAACNASSPNHSAFVSKWKGMCSSSMKDRFASSQESFIKTTTYDAAVKKLKKELGVDFNTFPPEVQMEIYSLAVAMGPGGAASVIKRVSGRLGGKLTDPPTSTETLLQMIATCRGNGCGNNYYASSSAAIQKSVFNRFAKEGAEAIESYKIRKAWEEEQANPSNPPKTLEDVVKEVTGKDMCPEGQSGTFSGSNDWTVGGEAGGSGGTNEKGAGKEAVTGYEGKDCSPQQYAATMDFCLFCPLFKVIFNTSSAIAKLAFDKLAKPVMTLVLIGFAIWIAVKMLAFLSSVEKKEAPALIKEIMHMSFVVMVVVLLLEGTSSQVFSLLMEPVFNTGFKLAQLVAGSGTCKEYGVMADGGLPASMGNSILCTVEAIQDKLIDTMALGTASMCVGFYIKASLFIFPSLPYVFSGLLIWGGAFVMMIIFPFLMLDSIFQLTVACALLPAAIGAYPFKYTKGKFVGKVWDTFINAMFNFIFLSIFIFILTTAIETTLTDSIAMSREEMNQNYLEVIVTQLTWAGIALLKIVFVLLLGWALMDEVKVFASNFSAGIANGSIGSQIGGLAGQGTKALGIKSWAGIKSAGKTIGRDVSQRVGNVRRNISEANLKAHGTATPVLDSAGNQIGTTYSMQSKSWLRGRDKTKSVTVAANGTKLFTTTKDYGNGKVKTTQQDGFMKITTTNNNGKITEDVSMQAAMMKSLRKKDGSINTIAWDNAVKNSAHAPEKLKAAMMLQYAQEALPGVNPKLLGTLNDAQINISTDANGNEVISIAETKSDGSSQVIRMTKAANKKTLLGGEISNGRTLLEVESTDKYGDRVSYATDGIINRKKESQVDKNGNVKMDKKGRPLEKTEYAVSDYYAKYVSHPVSSQGQFHGSIPADQIMFDDQEKDAAVAQLTEDRLKGRKHAIGGFK